MSWPVIIADSGGIPVTEAKNGLGVPYTIARNGIGTAVTLVEAGGLPVTRASYDPHYDPIAALGDDLIEFWDASRGDTIATYSDGTYTNSVSSWVGLITGANLAMGTPNLKPMYLSQGLAGGPCLSFDGVQQYLTCTDATLMSRLPSGTAPCEIWALVSQDAAGADATTRQAVGYANTSLANGRSIARVAVSNVSRARAYTGTGGSAAVATDSHVDLSGAHVMRGVFTAAQTSIDVDGSGALSAAAVPATGTPALFRVGAIPALAASNWWSGKIAAVLVTKPLSAEKAAALHSYLG